MQMLQKAHSYALQVISHKFLECFLCCSFQSFVLQPYWLFYSTKWPGGRVGGGGHWTESCFKKNEFQPRFESRQTSCVVRMHWEFPAWLLWKNLWPKNFGLIRTQVHATKTQKSKYLGVLRPVNFCGYIRVKHTLLSYSKCLKCVHTKTDIYTDFKKTLKSWLRIRHRRIQKFLQKQKKMKSQLDLCVCKKKKKQCVK